MRKRILFVALALLALGSLGFAQAKISLTIQSNQSGARVYLNDNLAGYTSPNFSVSVFPGTYTIRVVKDGFPEFRTKVVALQNPIIIVANLGGSPQTPPTPPAPIPPSPKPVSPSLPGPPSPSYRLSIDANVRGARAYINGSYAGTTPFAVSLPPGTYSISIRLDGYEDYTTTLRLSGPYYLYATLSSLQFSVYINAVNVPGASIYRDSTYIGNTPYRGTWARGSYLIRITAPGYADYAERTFVDGSTNMQVTLTPLPVDYEIRIPGNFMPSWKKSAKFNDLEIYLDGMRLESLYGKTMPGTHKIALVYKDLRLENDFEIEPGKPATIELSLGINVY